MDDEKRRDAAQWLAAQFGGDDEDETADAAVERDAADPAVGDGADSTADVAGGTADAQDSTADAHGRFAESNAAPTPVAPWSAGVPASPAPPASTGATPNPFVASEAPAPAKPFPLSTPPSEAPAAPTSGVPPLAGSTPPSAAPTPVTPAKSASEAPASPTPPAPEAPTPGAPVSGAAASSSGFSWGLRPSGTTPSDAAAAQPVAPTRMPTSPTTAPPPVTSPGLVVPPPAAVVPPATASPPVDPPTGAPLSAAPTTALPEATPPGLVVPPPMVTPQSPPELVQPPGHEPQPVDSSLAGPPASDSEPRTMALPWESAGTELFTPAASAGPIAEPATELLSGFETEAADAAAAASVDALFGEHRFRDYEAQPAAAAEAPVAAARAPRAPLPRSQKTLLWIAGILAALLVLIALFFLGTKIPRAGAATPVVTPTAKASPTPSATPTPAPVGPVAAGSYKWNLLRGGECISPFESPWAEKFTVVDCASPHPAQLVARGTFVEPTAAASDPAAPATPSVGGQPAAPSAYPGVAALQAQINLLCSAPTVIDFAAAGAYNDIQFTASYPANDKQWAKGDHDYYCFVTRSSGEPLTTSVAVAPAPPAA
ncbi:hypothetical protein [Parafrigoribacterium soli]|uniref:hypothetical protein n=1 Tax=Parafrigoribacterium soli TaxID=3144663 RepID=UPI0032F071C0